jgi:anti-sigma28 factor (negative regulator of flagellin synthesis)
MRIENGNIGNVAGNTSSGAVHPVGTEGGSVIDGRDGSSDSVSLSSASGLIALAKNVASLDRQSRVSALAAQVRSGSYQISPRDVAHAMLEQTAGAIP